MTDLADIAARFEATFTEIAETRMMGVPVMNPALGVAMHSLSRYGEHIAGILITPWFMNLIFIPAEPELAGCRVGAQTTLVLPSGRYDATWSHEEAVGGFWVCSLFSPMFEFEDMEAALATADAAWEEIMAPAAAPQRPADPAMAGLWPQEDEEGVALKPAPVGNGPDEEEDGPAHYSRRALFGLSSKEEPRA